MSITKISLRGLTARMFISPPPTTLGESTAVLKKLQSFGTVESFTRAAHAPMCQTNHVDTAEHQEVKIVFSSPETVKYARDASPFTVRINHNLPDPELEDPYNVRNLQSRKQPRPRTMTCRVEPFDEDLSPGQNILSKGFSPSNTTRLYQSLLDLKPPPAVAAGLGVLHTDISDMSSTDDLIETPPDLMKMYQSALSQSKRADNEKTSSPFDLRGLPSRDVTS